MEGWIGTGQIQKVHKQHYILREICVMSLKLIYYGQNDGSTVPDVVLTGDPGTDQETLKDAGFLGGRIMALKVPSLAQGLVAIVPCDADTMVPYATLLNGPGEFSGAIGPSGSRKAPVVRAMWQGIVDAEAFDGTSDGVYTLGTYLYCGYETDETEGLYVATAKGTAGHEAVPVAICTHVPTTAEPWLGVASLL
jgi:hypothetical protein